MAQPTQNQSAEVAVSARGLTGCVINGCGDPLVARGMCRNHLNRWYRATPNAARVPAQHDRRMSPEERFRQKVAVGAPGDCWPFLGSRKADGGHGVFHVSQQRGRVPAHSYALELATGERCPEGKEACHHCDNPPCCNPAHIYYGTRQENVDDCRRRQRLLLGERKPLARISDADAVRIRQLYDDGASPNDLASKYSIHPATVRTIVRGKAWAHVGGPIQDSRRRLSRRF